MVYMYIKFKVAGSNEENLTVHNVLLHKCSQAIAMANKQHWLHQEFLVPSTTWVNIRSPEYQKTLYFAII